MAGQQLRLRIKTKTGLKVLDGLFQASTVNQLKKSISEASSIPESQLKLRQGYPPKVVDIGGDNALLSSLPFRSGDTIIVEQIEAKPTTAEDSQSHSQVDSLLTHQLEDGASGILTRRVVPADNSCLFTSTYLVMNRGVYDLDAASTLRKVIAHCVCNDQDTYSEAFLGKPNKDYCKWICDGNSWGGGIELFILSQHFQTEIAVVDTQSGRVDSLEKINIIKRGFSLSMMAYIMIPWCMKQSINQGLKKQNFPSIML